MGKLRKTVIPKKRYIINTKDLAEVMNVSSRTLLLWKKKDLPYLEKGKYDLAIVFKWYIAKMKGAEKDASEVQELRESQEKYWKEKAELERLKVKDKSGEMVSLEQVRIESFEIGKQTKENLKAMVEQAAPELAAETQIFEIKRILLNSVNQTLSNLSAALKNNEVIQCKDAVTTIAKA